MANNKKILLLSSGLDSFILWRVLHQPPAIFFNIHARNSSAEMERIVKIKQAFDIDNVIRIIDAENLGQFENLENGYIPFRNLIFFIKANLYFPSHDIYIGQIKEWQRDKNARFYRQVEKIIRSLNPDNKQHVRICAPFADKSKTEIVALYNKLFPHRDNNLDHFTFSCLTRSDIHCGQCTSCIMRYAAFKLNGIEGTWAVAPRKEFIKTAIHTAKRKFRLALLWRLFFYRKNIIDIRKAFSKKAPNR